MNNDEKKEFLYQSISDIQSTIRALDAKLGAIFVLLVLPITYVSSIYTRIHFLLSSSNKILFTVLYFLIFFIHIVSWLAAFYLALKGVNSIDDPKKHIKGIKGSGMFYSGGLFKFNILDAFKNRNIKSGKGIQEICRVYSSNNLSVIYELIFEQMKLSYIRDIKIKRQTWSFIFMIAWLISGFVIYLVTQQ